MTILRRKLTCVAASTMLLMLLPSIVSATSATAGSDSLKDGHSLAESGKPYFSMTVRADLTHEGKAIELFPGEASPVLDFEEKGAFRVKCSLTGRKSAFGPIYLLVISDEAGREIESMFIGSNTTATFSPISLQVYMMAVNFPGTNVFGQ